MLFKLCRYSDSRILHKPKQSIFVTISYREKPNTMQQCIKILLFIVLSEAQHVTGDTPPIIRSLNLHKQPLVLHAWKVVGRAVVGRCQVAYAAFHVCKTRGCLCSFRLLMMGGVSSETCWASFKIKNNKILVTLLHLVGVFTVKIYLFYSL